MCQLTQATCLSKSCNSIISKCTTLITTTSWMAVNLSSPSFTGMVSDLKTMPWLCDVAYYFCLLFGIKILFLSILFACLKFLILYITERSVSLHIVSTMYLILFCVLLAFFPFTCIFCTVCKNYIKTINTN